MIDLEIEQVLSLVNKLIRLLWKAKLNNIANKDKENWINFF